MKTKLVLPRLSEAKGIEAEGVPDENAGDVTAVNITHRLFRGQKLIPVCFIECVGEKGNKTETVLLLDVTRGKYSVQSLEETGSSPFDLPPAEYQKELQLVRARSQKKKGKDGNTPDKDVPGDAVVPPDAGDEPAANLATSPPVRAVT